MRCDSLSRSSLSIWSSWGRPRTRTLAMLMVWLLVPALNPTWWDAGYWRSGAPAMALSNAAAPLADDQIAPWLGHQRSLPQDETPSHEAGVLAFVERTFPSVADKLGQRAHFVESLSGDAKGWRPTHEPLAPAGLKPEEQKAWLAMAARQPSAAGLSLFFPEIFTRPQEVAADGLHLEVHAVGARSVRGQVVDGRMVYADAWPETDAIYTAGAGHSEEFLHLRDTRAPTTFTHRLMAGSGAPTLARVEVQSDGSVEVADAAGRRIQIARPYVVDARGARSESAVTWQALPTELAGIWDLRLEVRATGLVYPLLVDPSWVTVHYMNQSRANHTATLLPSGKLLVAGGTTIGGNVNSVEIYDPVLDIWTDIAPLPFSDFSHTTTLLPSGSVLFVGTNFQGLSTVALCDPAAGTWTTLPATRWPRRDHTATLLASGKVLVVGGTSSPGTGELFDPATATWSDTGPLQMGRSNHTATRLSSGQVLLVGGRSGGHLTHAELFDPATATWTATTHATFARSRHTATALPSGQVLVIGGVGAAGDLASVEQYDPVYQTWTTRWVLPSPRSDHSATLLPSGKVLVLGGSNAGTSLATSVLLDVVGNVWSASDPLLIARYQHTATLMPSGSVLVLGGYGPSGVLSHAEQYYNAAGAAWSPTAALSTARSHHTATTLPSGKVLVVGGHGSAGTLAGAELFDPSSGTWENVVTAPQASRAYHTATTLPSGRVLVLGGTTDGPVAEVFDPDTALWAPLGARENFYFHTATLLPSGKVLVVGVNEVTEQVDPADGSWTPSGAVLQARAQHSATLLPGGKVLIAGGDAANAGGALATAELFDSTTGTWSRTASMATGRSEHTATLLPSGKVLVAGGINTSRTFLASAELYDPASGTWSSAGTMNISRNGHSACLLSSGKVLVVGGATGGGYASRADLFDPLTLTWTDIPAPAAGRYGHTTSVLRSGQVLLAGGANGTSTPTRLTSTEILSFDADAGRRPLLTGVVQRDGLLIGTGSGFAPSLSASGDGRSSSASNLPCVQLQRRDDGRCWILEPRAGYGDTSVTSAIPAEALGPCWMRVLVNGISSEAVALTIGPPSISLLSSSKIHIADNGDTATVTAILNRRYHLPITFDLLSGGVATSPNDFTLSAERLTIPVGALTATTLLTGRNLDRVSGDRALTLTAINASNAAVITAPVLALTIASSNRAPVISDAVNTLPGIYGGQTSADTPVTKLFFGKISDLDVGDGKGIAVTATTGTGTWSYTIDNGANWLPIGAVSDSAALLLSEAGSTQVRYFAPVGVAHTASITYRAWDRTSRSEGERVALGVGGGTTAFSTDSSSTTLAVASQAAPVVTLSTTTASWTEGTAPLQIDGGATCTDADSPNFSGGNITVTMTPNNRVGDRLDYDSALTGGIVRTAAELRTADGALLGTLSGGNDGAPLIISLTAATTPTIAQTMLRGLTYANIGGNPEVTPTGTGQRTIVISVDDETAARGTSQAKVVTLQAVDGAPIVEPLTVSLVPGLKVSNQLIARDPEGLGLTFVLESNPTKGDATLDPNSGLITYHNTVLDGQNDSFQVRVSDGLQTTLSTVTVQVTAGNANGLRFTSVAPLVWRSGVVLSYTPTITGTTATVRYSLVPPPQEAKTGNPLVPTTHYLFQTETGTVRIEATLPHPDGNYLRFGILAVDTVNGTSAYQPVLIKFLVAGSG